MTEEYISSKELAMKKIADFMVDKPCGTCGGTGFVRGSECPECRGLGHTRVLNPEEGEYCPSCMKALEPDQEECPFCGMRIASSRVAEGSPIPPTMGGAPETVVDNEVANEVLSMIRGASVAKLRLWIKGSPEQAEEALKAHGITDFELFNYGDYNTCQYDATTDWNTAGSWLGENNGMKPEEGVGYPVGTLVFYQELNGDDPKMEATGSRDTKVGPLRSITSDTADLDEDTFMTDEEREELEEEKKRERFHPEDEPDSIMDSASGGNRGFQSNGPFIGAPGMPGQFASKREAGFSTRGANKLEIQGIYDSLTLASTNDRSFRKPSFAKINDDISIGDNGSAFVFSGTYQGHPFGPGDYINAEDAGMWYELEGVPEDLFNKQGSIKKRAGSPGDPDGDGVINMDDYTCDKCGVRSGDYHDPEHPGFTFVNGGSWCGKCWDEMGAMGVQPYKRASKRMAKYTGDLDSDFSDTALIPQVAVESVANEICGYLGKLEAEGEYTSKLTQELQDIYRNNQNWARKVKDSDSGRDYLYSFLYHWAASFAVERGDMDSSSAIEWQREKGVLSASKRTAAPSALREIKPGDKCIYTNHEGKEFHVTIVSTPFASEDYGTIVGVQGIPEEGWAEGDWDNVDLMSLRLDPAQNELIGG